MLSVSEDSFQFFSCFYIIFTAFCLAGNVTSLDPTRNIGWDR